MRLFLAFAILPFVAAALAYFGYPFFERNLLRQVGGSFTSDASISFAAATAFLTVVVTVLGAVPLVVKMRRRGPITYKQSVLAGIALGNAPFLIVSALILVVHLFVGTPENMGPQWYGASGALRTITLSTLMGAALGSVFWVVGIRGAEARRN